MRDIAQDIRSAYTISYVPTNTAHKAIFAGSRHGARPERGDLRVHDGVTQVRDEDGGMNLGEGHRFMRAPLSLALGRSPS